MPNNETRRELFRRWEFWCGLVGVFAALFAVYVYIVTSKIGRVSYILETQKVFDQQTLPEFRLVTKDGVAIGGTVYATELIIWNSGDLSLSKNSDRIREDVKFTISGPGEIHYFILGNVNVVTADNYQIHISEDRKTLNLKWQFFDPGQGLRITIVHTGEERTITNLMARFFEAALVQVKIKQEEIRGAAGFYLFGTSTGFLSVLFGLGVIYFVSRRRPESHSYIMSLIVGLAMSFLGIVLLIMTYRIQLEIPPI